METGTVDVADLDGPFDLQSTLESGQSYGWNRVDGHMYETLAAHGGDAWYEAVVPPVDGVSAYPAYLRVRQVGGVDDGRLEWVGARLRPARSDGNRPGNDRAGDASRDLEVAGGLDAVPLLTHLLRLDDDLAAIYDATPADPLLARAVDRYRGMRLVRDPPFACLVSFICSAQMRVERIHGMQNRLREALGATVLQADARRLREGAPAGDRPVVGNGGPCRTGGLAAFPTPEALAGATEAALRDLSLGYRAPYVRETAAMVQSGEADPAAVRDTSYADAREALTRFVGVGDKVADCVLLFSLGFLEAVPLDTWIRSAIADHYPDCDRGSYAETSSAIRERFGGEYAGYAQTYVFHHLRTGGS